MTKVKKAFSFTLLALLLAVGIVGCGNSSSQPAANNNSQPAVEQADSEKKLAEPLVLRMGHVLAESEPTQQAALEFAERVKERTNGEIEIKVFANASLGSDVEVTEQAKLGNPVIGYTNPTYLEDMAKDISIMGGPFLVNSWDELKKIVDSDFMKEQEEILQENGLRVLAFNWYFGSRHYISDREIRNPDDLAGVKIRTSPNPLWEETIKAMGANPTPLNWAEVYPAIEQKVINGAEAPMTTIYGSKLHEVANHISKTAHFSQVNGWVMSEKIFSSLPEEYQNILLEEARAAGDRMSQITIEKSDEVEQMLIDEGVIITEPDREAFREATKVVYDILGEKWTPGLYDRIQQIIAE